MRLEEYKLLIQEECGKIIDPVVYDRLLLALSDPSYVIFFVYKRIDETFWNYRRVTPIGFVYTGFCYLYSMHEIHPDAHYFKIDRISDIYVYKGFVDSLINISDNPRFWNGDVFVLESTPKLEG